MTMIPPTAPPTTALSGRKDGDLFLSPRLKTPENHGASQALTGQQPPNAHGADRAVWPVSTGNAPEAGPPTAPPTPSAPDRPRRNFVLCQPTTATHGRVRLPVVTLPYPWLEDRRPECVTVDLGFDRCGRRRSRATDPSFRRGIKPANAGLRYYPTPYTDEQVLAFMAACPDTRAWRRMRALIALLWRSGLRISEALDLYAADLDPVAGTVLVRHGKGNKRGISAMDPFGFEIVMEWLAEREATLPPGPVFPVAEGSTKGQPWTPAGVRQGFARLKVRAGFEGRFAPHQLRHSCAVGLAMEGVLLPLISKQLHHSNIATTSTYLSGISPQDVINAISARPAPSISVPDEQSVLVLEALRARAGSPSVFPDRADEGTS